MLALRHTMLCIVGAAIVSAGCAHASATERAQALVRAHQDEEAMVFLKDWLRGHPGDVPARRLLVRLLGLAGDLPEARVEVEDLKRWVPAGDPTPYIELGHALELSHEFEEALAAYDEASSVAPLSPDGPREGGMRAARWGELEQAGPRLEEAVRRGARDAEVWHALGLVRLNLGDYDGAERAYHQGTLAEPKAPSNWLGLATVAVARGDAEAALMAYEQVLARVPRFADAELGRAWALAKLGHKDLARRALDRAEELGAARANLSRQRAALDDSSPVGPRSGPERGSAPQ
jgi:tetratricopeptide (TPR) repeat protein